jgi:hypothetical protein
LKGIVVVQIKAVENKVVTEGLKVSLHQHNNKEELERVLLKEM